MPRTNDAPSSEDIFQLCCYIGSTEFGGMEASLVTLLKALPPRFEVTLLGSSTEVLSQVATARHGTTIRLLPAVRRRSDVRRIGAQIRALRQIRADVIHISMGHPYQTPYALFAALVTRTPMVAVIHGTFARSGHRQDALIRWIIRRVRVVAAVSQFVRQRVESEYRLPRGTVRVLYNGVEQLAPSVPPTSVKKEGVTVLGAVGRCAHEKGFDVLIRALVELPDCRLILLGEGPMLPNLVRLAEENHVLERVNFVGWVDPPWTSKWKFDLLIVPSREEGFGLVVLEAFLAGIPVIASRVGGIPEIIDDGITGVLVEPGDPSALAAAIEQLARAPLQRSAMSKRGAISVPLRFSTDAMVRAYERTFDEARLR